MEEKGKYKWLASGNVRELTFKMNELGIKKSNIISLLFNEQYILVYFD